MHLNQQKNTTEAIKSQFNIVVEEDILFNDPSSVLSQEYFELFTSQDVTPAESIAQLEQLIRKYNDEPTLVSHLATAYRRIENYEQANQIVRNNYRRFPLSVFARCDYALLCLEENHLTKAAAAIDYTFDLSHLYPNRSQFHVLEVIDFNTCVINYFCAIKDFERAVYALGQLQLTSQDVRIVDSLRTVIITAILKENLSVESIKKLVTSGEKEVAE